MGIFTNLKTDFRSTIKTILISLHYSENGDTILDMRARLPSVIDTPADAVILLWDSGFN